LSTDVPPEDAVNVSFEPFVAAVRSGAHFTLAAHFRIAPGYRLAWQASGDGGKATTVTFRAPAGFDVGPTQFPAPTRFPTAGGGSALGYEGETAMFADVKAPNNLRPDDVVRLDMFAEWSACRDECRIARTAAFVELETTRGDGRAKSVEAELAPFRARLPRALPRFEETWKLTQQDATLLVHVKGVTFTDFFSDGRAKPAPLDVTTPSGDLAIRYDDAPGAGTRPVRGLAAGTADGKDVFYEYEVKPRLPAGSVETEVRKPK
jgi:thiol:disulfide interchange protein DsbD